MTPVETLREAARLMRERAEAVPPSPWYAVTIGDPGPFSPDRDWIVDSPESLIVGRLGDEDEPGATARAAYIAAMHPGVVLAVADWLDAFAPAVDSGGNLPGEQEAALAVARAYLGGGA